MTDPFSRKISGFSCDLRAHQKIKQLRANAVEMRLGVKGLLVDVNYNQCVAYHFDHRVR